MVTLLSHFSFSFSKSMSAFLKCRNQRNAGFKMWVHHCFTQQPNNALSCSPYSSVCNGLTELVLLGQKDTGSAESSFQVAVLLNISF